MTYYNRIMRRIRPTLQVLKEEEAEIDKGFQEPDEVKEAPTPYKKKEPVKSRKDKKYLHFRV